VVGRHPEAGHVVVVALGSPSAGPGDRPALARRAVDAIGPHGADAWLTGLDPQGEARAQYAPGGRHVLVELHDVLLGHGRAADALREAGAEIVGAGVHLEVTRPADPARTQDLDAALDADLLTNHVVLGPLLDGSYPVAARAASGLADWDHVRPGDLVAIRRRLDVLAVTHSGTRTVSRGADGDRFVHAATTPGSRAAEPDGLYEILCAMDNAYLGVPLIGVVPTGEGEVGHAGGLAVHEAAARRAREDGADVRGLAVLGERAPGEGT
ncbi:MAG: family 1 glycosylhydrolase, partial [Actinomycetaceae bacterium]